MKKVLKVIAAVIGAVILIAGCYVAYVFIDYHRIEDNLTLDVAAGEANSAASGAQLP